jgi:hypothetical protein
MLRDRDAERLRSEKTCGGEPIERALRSDAGRSRRVVAGAAPLVLGVPPLRSARDLTKIRAGIRGIGLADCPAVGPSRSEGLARLLDGLWRRVRHAHFFDLKIKA